MSIQSGHLTISYVQYYEVHFGSFWNFGNVDEMVWNFHITIIVTKTITFISITAALFMCAKKVWKVLIYTLQSFHQVLYRKPLNDLKWRYVLCDVTVYCHKTNPHWCCTCVLETPANFGRCWTVFAASFSKWGNQTHFQWINLKMQY